jgi:hypothetical protein
VGCRRVIALSHTYLIPARCAFLRTNAQRAPADVPIPEQNRESEISDLGFPHSARCAFALKKAQRASYG